MKCTIDLAPSGAFVLGLPSTTSEDFHHVNVPATADGIKILRKILAERQRETRKEIGNTASPIQVQVEAWLTAERRERAAEAKAKTEPKSNGVDLSGLNIGELDL
jgi:predicted DNA-binding ribbon-helix-helix protein